MDERDYLLTTACVNYLLPRGKKSRVPEAVAAEIKRSELAADRFYASIDDLKQSV